MNKKFNENILKALESSHDALRVCKQAMIDANDVTCWAMYSSIITDFEKHIELLI